MQKKQIAAGLMILAMVLSLSGCSGGNSQSAAETGKTGKKEENVELSMICWGSQTRQEYTQKAIDVFEEQHPGITINLEFTSWDGYWQKLAAMAASKELPDIIQMDYSKVVQYDNGGLIIDLMPHVESGIIDLSDCEESLWKSGIINDKLLGGSVGTNSMVTVINDELMEQAGLEIPDDEWTWTDYTELCSQIMEKKDELGIKWADQYSEAAIDINQLTFEMLEADCNLFSQDGNNTFGFDKEEGRKVFVHYFETMKDMIEKGYIAPLAIRDEISVNGVENGSIIRGETIMDTGHWTNQLEAMTEAAGHHLTIISMPNHTEKRVQPMRPSQLLCVASNSEHPEEAALFINEWTNNVDMNLELKAERGVPISSKVRAALAETMEEDSAVLQTFDYVDRMAAKAGELEMPEPASYGAIETLIRNAMKDVVDNGGEPNEVYDSFYEQAMTEFEMTSEEG